MDITAFSIIERASQAFCRGTERFAKARVGKLCRAAQGLANLRAPRIGIPMDGLRIWRKTVFWKSALYACCKVTADQVCAEPYLYEINVYFDPLLAARAANRPSYVRIASASASTLTSMVSPSSFTLVSRTVILGWRCTYERRCEKDRWEGPYKNVGERRIGIGVRSGQKGSVRAR